LEDGVRKNKRLLTKTQQFVVTDSVNNIFHFVAQNNRIIGQICAAIYAAKEFSVAFIWNCKLNPNGLREHKYFKRRFDIMRNLKSGILAVLASCLLGLAICSQAQAETTDKLIYLKCQKDNTTGSSVIFEGLVRATTLELSTSLVSVVGHEFQTQRKQIANPKCSNSYIENYCDNDDICRDYVKTRNWNAIELISKRSTLILNCSATSTLLEIFADTEDFLDHTRSKRVDSSTKPSESEVTDNSCIFSSEL
jgi:hypothetical protein